MSSQFNEIDLQPDDLSFLLRSDDLMANIDFQANPKVTTAKSCNRIEIDARPLVPVSDDDESISDTSLWSHLSFDPVDEELSSAETSEKPPSFERMVSKLNSMMRLSALSRAIISKTVFEDLNKKTRNISSVDSSSTTKPSLHKARRSSSKHTHRTNDKISTDSVRLGSRQDSSIGGFLRASKKW
eukprot:CAMPEP_0113614038 /NCGR_PEP_ID=MMETSP0017_2-20120614/6955_1 /TAXON_ID=2856 /ORGANISM="Cylindrotheca closterium" /LENGTH=184 /DNA_ID=CAMNT_0000523183 /DNA_START=25 /DNA_END=579 /DNA_ORIENTATION=+ /assembly_acc=CAM_ASM_000147